MRRPQAVFVHICSVALVVAVPHAFSAVCVGGLMVLCGASHGLTLRQWHNPSGSVCSAHNPGRCNFVAMTPPAANPRVYASTDTEALRLWSAVYGICARDVFARKAGAMRRPSPVLHPMESWEHAASAPPVGVPMPHTSRPCVA
ncbi:hypothetical protein DFH06DRAFT_1336976 [Mycena polygramma]|nr:hypothetical protein DFH06DRAFT_1336976 [Mycena polygramma]